MKTPGRLDGNCPCKTCLVRPTCGKQLIKTKPSNQCKYLIVEYAEKCPYIQEYFGSNGRGGFNHHYNQIYEICKIFKATNNKYFLWFANELN